MESTLHAVGRRVGALAAALACGSVLLWAATKGPDAGSYTATDEAIYSFVDISGSSGGSGILAGTDDGTAVLTLPFAVRFYGQSYSLACVSTNGALYFVTAAAACSGYDADFANTDLTVAPVPNDPPALLPFWSDLTFQVPGAGSVFYQTVGAEPDRRFVVQWHDAYPQGSANPVTFQAVLTEGSHAILFQYLAVDLGAGNPATSGAQATVGIRNAGGVANRQQIQWSYLAPVIHNRTALRFDVTIAPPVLTARAAGRQVQLNWTNVNAASYTVYRGTTPGGPYTRTAKVPGTQLVYVDRGLSVGATYYWIVRPLTVHDEEVGQSNQVSAKIVGR